MVAKTSSALLEEIAAKIPDGMITPARLRAVLNDIVASYPNAADTPPISMAGILALPAISLARAAVADADHAVSTEESTVAYTSLSTSRVVTLPAARVFAA